MYFIFHMALMYRNIIALYIFMIVLFSYFQFCVHTGICQIEKVISTDDRMKMMTLQ